MIKQKVKQHILVIVQDQEREFYGFSHGSVSNGDVAGSLAYSHIGEENFSQAFELFGIKQQKNATV